MNIQISQADLFPQPVFQVPVPEMVPHHAELIELFQQQIRSGKIKPHAHGYGYQSATNLFDPQVYPLSYLRGILMAKFHLACREILAKTKTDFPPGCNHHWVNTFNAGWAVIQTSETWAEEIPWHTHLPAVLSGCYYVSTAQSANEGVLQFLNPGAANLFQPKIGAISPKAGTLLIFPSGLCHRPTATPSNGNKIRLAMCMDGHWTSRLGGTEVSHPATRSASGWIGYVSPAVKPPEAIL